MYVSVLVYDSIFFFFSVGCNNIQNGIEVQYE